MLSNHRSLFFFGNLARDSILFITHDLLRLKGEKNSQVLQTWIHKC